MVIAQMRMYRSYVLDCCRSNMAIIIGEELTMEKLSELRSRKYCIIGRCAGEQVQGRRSTTDEMLKAISPRLGHKELCSVQE